MTVHSSVLLSHDGGIDDFLALLLLTTSKHVDLLGVVVTPADCYLEAAVRVSRKILHWRNLDNVPVIASPVRGVNSFPPEYRRDCLMIDRLPILNERLLPESAPSNSVTSTESSVQQIRALLKASTTAVTWLETGPLTTLAQLVQDWPETREKLERIVWMGGALTVNGNVEPLFAPENDGSAEWNAFWDPMAVQAVLKQTQPTDSFRGLPLILCPLDATNQVPVTLDFIKKLSQQRNYPCSDFAGQCYALAACQDYYCWDVLTATYVAAPELFDVQGIGEDIKIVVETQGPGQGSTQLKACGYSVQLISPQSPTRIRDYLLKQWSQ